MMHSSQRRPFTRSFTEGGRRSPSLGPPIRRSDTVFIGTEIAVYPTTEIGSQFVSIDPFMSSPAFSLLPIIRLRAPLIHSQSATLNTANLAKLTKSSEVHN